MYFYDTHTRYSVNEVDAGVASQIIRQQMRSGDIRATSCEQYISVFGQTIIIVEIKIFATINNQFLRSDRGNPLSPWQILPFF